MRAVFKNREAQLLLLVPSQTAVWDGDCCGMEIAVGWRLLWDGDCCGMEIAVGWRLLSDGNCYGIVVVWRLLYRDDRSHGILWKKWQGV